MPRSKILTEHQRQDKYLSQLPAHFEFPLFSSIRALQSQRKSGYRNTAAAAREIVDNAIEAGAERVHVIFERPKDREKFQRKDAVASVAFIDNGAGMSADMARFALSWGGGTHFDPGDQDFIGRFGFGLPNASINQTQRVEVYTRRSASEPFWKVWLDIREITAGQHSQSIPPAVQAELPAFVQAHLKQRKWELQSGTVVVWIQPDRLSYRASGSLREHMLNDFGVTYRYLLDDVELMVAGTTVEKVDPLFLMADARYYRRADEGGTQVVVDEAIPVRYYEDPNTGDKHLVRIESTTEVGDATSIAEGAIKIRVVRLPPGFAVGRGDVPPLDEHSRSRFEIRKPRRGMSFVRARREIETVDAFPRSASDVASGLGDWPLLQSHAYHWAVEVTFPALLDEVFGITNDKQTVRPVEDFWRLLAKEEIDAALQREQAWQASTRARLKIERQTAALEQRDEGEPSPAEFSAAIADAALGTPTSVPDHKADDANLNLERRAQEQAEETGQPVDEIRKALEQQKQKRKYRIDYIDDENGPFFTPDWEGLQVVVKINRKHPFFTTLYSGLVQLPGGKLAKEAVDLVLVTLARGEIKVENPTTTEFYKAQREQKWTPFLATALRTLAREYPDHEEDQDAA